MDTENTYFQFIPIEIYYIILRHLEMLDICNILGDNFYLSHTQLFMAIIKRDFGGIIRTDLISIYSKKRYFAEDNKFKKFSDLIRSKYNTFLKDYIQQYILIYKSIMLMIDDTIKLNLKSTISFHLFNKIVTVRPSDNNKYILLYDSKYNLSRELFKEYEYILTSSTNYKISENRYLVIDNSNTYKFTYTIDIQDRNDFYYVVVNLLFFFGKRSIFTIKYDIHSILS